MTKNEKIEEFLNRGVEKIYPSKERLEAILMSGKKLRIYNGIDPTGKLHIGHLVVLKKLRQFQDLGHEIIVLIGDFTATIGDPTGKNSARKSLTRKQVLNNAKNYKKQIGKVLDLNKPSVKFLYNGAWLNKLKPSDLIKLTSYFTVAKILERDMFQKRIREGRDILLHEFLYPVFQAYDSVAMDVDLEIGGSDQMFNMMRGRDLMDKMKNKEKFVVTMKLLTDPTGKKMGKTEGNFVAIDDSPEEMFGKIMSWPDSLIDPGLELLTDLPPVKEKPREAKARLAKEIITVCHNQKAAEEAEKEFNKIFKEKRLPTEIPKIFIQERMLGILDLLIKTKLVISKAEAKRLVEQGGVEIDSEIKKDWRERVAIKKGQVIRVGKRKFIKIS